MKNEYLVAASVAAFHYWSWDISEPMQVNCWNQNIELWFDPNFFLVDKTGGEKRQNVKTTLSPFRISVEVISELIFLVKTLEGWKEKLAESPLHLQIILS